MNAYICCALGIAVAALFEVTYAYVDARWDTPADKDEWLIGVWSIVIAVLICCGAMPLTPKGLLPWGPFYVVFVFHIFLNSFGGTFARRSVLPPRYPPSTTPPANSDGRDVKKITPNNNQDA
jgi:hypothetical protein